MIKNKTLSLSPYSPGFWEEIDGNTGVRTMGSFSHGRGDDNDMSLKAALIRNQEIADLMKDLRRDSEPSDLMKAAQRGREHSAHLIVERDSSVHVVNETLYPWQSGHGPGVVYLRCVVHPGAAPTIPTLWISLDGEVPKRAYDRSQWNVTRTDRVMLTNSANVLLDTVSTNTLEQGMPGLIRCVVFDKISDKLDTSKILYRVYVMDDLPGRILLWVSENALRTFEDKLHKP